MELFNYMKKWKEDLFPYGEVKDHIKRGLAMEQLSSSITPEMFWKEFDVTWFYGE